MAEKDLKALFVHQLKDTYFAENAILKALPQMAEAAQSDELRGALAIHLRETEGQVKRLEQVFQIVGEQPEGVECKAIQGIIEEGQEILQAFQGGEASDAGLIAAAQAVEHYEITRYGTLLAWAKQLGLSEAEGLIQETLIEEENTDEILSDLAEDAINPAAAAAYQPVDEVVVQPGRWSKPILKTIRAGPALFATKTMRMAPSAAPLLVG